MKLYYLNDEQREVTVRVMDNRYDPVTGTGDTFTLLKSCEGRMFEVVLPPDTALYVKKWPTVVLLSYIDLAVLPQSGQELQDGEDA